MSDRIKIFIIDFEDSFTFNIASELYNYEKNILVISHTDFFSEKNFLNFSLEQIHPTAIVLGPGPGNPEEFRDYFFKIAELKKFKNLFIMGICLGHQILALMDGYVVKSSIKPIHGGQVKINFDDKNILVQRYNSLAVYEKKDCTVEIQIRQWDRGVSYQFHPESIGTEDRHLFFKVLVSFLALSPAK